MPNFYNLLRARKFTTAADTAVEIAPYDSATPNFVIEAGGKLKWSSGSATADTTLYRSSANVLRTDDSFDIASGQTYKIDGTDVLTATTLGSAVTNSSLTTLGQISSLQATTPTFSGQATFSGPTTINNTLTLQQSLEKTNPIGNITGTTAINVLTSAVHSATSTGNFTLNFRGDGSTTLNSLMSNNQSMTVVVMVANTTARTLSGIQIDGATPNITTLWFGGTGIPAGNANSTDVYTFSIVKTGSATYTVYASQSKFA